MGYINTPATFGTPTDVSGSRVLSVYSTHEVYQPNAYKATLVYVSFDCSSSDDRIRAGIKAASGQCFADSDGVLISGTLLVGQANFESSDGYQEGSLSFIVPAGWYYEVIAPNSIAEDGWVEVTLW